MSCNPIVRPVRIFPRPAPVVLRNLTNPVLGARREIAGKEKARDLSQDHGLSVLAEEEGFEPSIRETRMPDFESGAFNHSATPPEARNLADRDRKLKHPRVHQAPAAQKLGSRCRRAQSSVTPRRAATSS